jgi:hypothetical protein
MGRKEAIGKRLILPVSEADVHFTEGINDSNRHYTGHSSRATATGSNGRSSALQHFPVTLKPQRKPIPIRIIFHALWKMNNSAIQTL